MGGKATADQWGLTRELLEMLWQPRIKYLICT